LRRGAQHLLVALIIVSADEFLEFLVSIHRRYSKFTRQFMTPLTAIAA